MDLVEAFKIELRKLIDEPNFGVKTFVKLERVARACRGFFIALSGRIGDISGAQMIEGDPDAESLPGSFMTAGGVVPLPSPSFGALAPSPLTETGGAAMIRELVKMVPQILGQSAQKNNGTSLKTLIETLAIARDHDMTDLIVELEKKILDKLADDPRPQAVLKPHEEDKIEEVSP